MFACQQLRAGLIDRDLYSHQVGGKRCSIKVGPFQNGKTPVIRAQCYSTVKAPTYSHKSTKGLFELSIKDLMNPNSTALENAVLIAKDAFIKNMEFSFSARLEYRIQGLVFPTGFQIRTQMYHMKLYKPMIFVDSDSYHLLLSRRLEAYTKVIKKALKVVQRDPGFHGQVKVLIGCMLHLIKALFSRPNDRSWSRELSR